MENFSFLDPRVLETLLGAKKRGTEFMGSATSDFQSHPYLGGDKAEAAPRSDWEMQIHRLIGNKSHKIVGEQSISEFPEFFKKREFYLKRCTELGENMFRFSFDFGRLCPRPGEFDTALMAEYVAILATIRDRGLEPMLTLYHWPSPVHLLKLDQDENIIAGAWEHPEIVRHFHFYLKNVLHHLADKDFLRATLRGAGYGEKKIEQLIEDGLVRYFVSVNEPINLLLPTYLLGWFPPFKKFRFDLLSKVTSKVVEAHDLVLTEVHESKLPTRRGPLQVGAAHNWTYFEGWFSGVAHHLVNRRLARKFEEGKRHTDFVGLHYYFRLKYLPFSRERKIYGDNPYFGDVHPPGIAKVLGEMGKEYPGKPLFITEFGFSDNHDLRRPYWILETVRHVIEAMERGVPVKGMLLWTLVNNFEWNLGVHQKFGLFSEAELEKPLTPSSGIADGSNYLHGIKGWEAWRAATTAVLSPSREHLMALQRAYDRAREQFREATEGKR